MWSRSDTPCTLPGSSTGCWDRSFAVLAPSRHMSLSDLRGNFTGNRAWSAVRGHRQDIVLPVLLVCIIPCAAFVDLRELVSRQLAGKREGVIMSSQRSDAGPWLHSRRRYPVPMRQDRRCKRCRHAIACMMTASLRATATRALAWHLVFASFSPHVFSVSRPLKRVSSADAAS